MDGKNKKEYLAINQNDTDGKRYKIFLSFTRYIKIISN